MTAKKGEGSGKRLVVLWGISLEPNMTLSISHDADCILSLPKTKDIAGVTEIATRLQPHLFLCNGRLMLDILRPLGRHRVLEQSANGTLSRKGPLRNSEGRATPGTVRLSERDKQVLFFLFRGFRNREIAERLGVATRTVKGYLTELFSRLEVENRTELIFSAISLGLIQIATGHDPTDPPQPPSASRVKVAAGH